MKNCFKVTDFIHSIQTPFHSVNGKDYMDTFNYIWLGVRIEHVSMYHVAATIRENTKIYI